MRINVLALLLSALPLGSLAAQSLQITSPISGTVVNSGQSVTVSVEASGTFQEVLVIGQSPFGDNQQSLTGPPYQFTVPVSGAISPGQYILTAMGIAASGPVYSDTARGGKRHGPLAPYVHSILSEAVLSGAR